MSTKEKYLWGTYGPHALHFPIVIWKPLDTLTTEHLVNILRTQYQITGDYRRKIAEILGMRGLSMNKVVSLRLSMGYEQLKLPEVTS